MRELEDHVVLVAGANRPIGRAIARRFGGNGAHLVLPVFDDWPGATVDMEHDFRAAGYSYRIIPCDLTSREETARLCDQVGAEHRLLHVLVNNIERGGMPVVHGSYDHAHNRDQWQLEIDTTLKAKYNLFRQALPLLKQSGRGSALTISSIAACVGRCGPASLLFSDGYSAANRAVASFTEQWAREGAPEVRVNELMLGLVDGRHGTGTRGWNALTAEQRQALLDRTPLRRTGNPEEIAEIAYFLAVKAAYVTGSRLVVDGGYCLGSESVWPLPPGIL